jgi:SAM-dependent methyltransferase
MEDTDAPALGTDFYDQPDIYDAIVAAGRYLPFYVDLARLQGGPVLDLACGTGQFTVPIAGLGLPTTGLDLSPGMLEAARARAAAAAVSIELVLGDMRRFDLGRTFALICIPRNSLVHLIAIDEYLALFAAVRRHLQPGGLFAFDILNPNLRELARPAGERVPTQTIVSERFGELSVEMSHDYDAATQVNRGTLYVSTPSRRESWVFPMHLRSIFPQELPLLLAAGGFRLVTRVGDFTREPFQSSSYRQVCVCEVDPLASTWS